MVGLFPELARVGSSAIGPPPVPDVPKGNDLGRPYEPADERASQTQRDPFPVDPTAVERGIRSHAVLQNMLAAHVADLGFEPKKPEADDPAWDVLWRDAHGTVWVAEVKSLTKANEERQLRLGLGQLLRYRHRLRQHERRAEAVLMVEQQPSDETWPELCEELGVTLLWPGILAQLSS